MGKLPSRFEVTDDGQAVYTIPLDVPVGTAGLRPQLSLEYRSYRKNGLLGMGWVLTGFSEIARCPTISAHNADTYARPVAAVPADSFCLDGRLLKPVASDRPVQGAEYRTEVETFSRVTPVNQRGEQAGPEGFVVWAKDGRILKYGFTPDAKTERGGIRYRWRLSEIRDRHNNVIQIVYGRACGPTTPGKPVQCTPHAPKEIRYGIHDGAPALAADRFIRFVYEARSDFDNLPVFEHGFAEREWRRLARIAIEVRGEQRRGYAFEYAGGPLTLLKAVRECAIEPSGVEVCKPPTSMDYHTADVGFGGGFVQTAAYGSRHFGNGQSSPWLGRTIVLDANGDGRDDILYPRPSKYDPKCQYKPIGCSNAPWRYELAIATGDAQAPLGNERGVVLVDPKLGRTTWLASGTGYTDPSGTVYSGKDPEFCISQSSVFDYNGDGRDDLLVSCGFHAGRVLVSHGDGRFTAEDPDPTIVHGSARRWLADVNGDRLLDVVGCRGYQGAQAAVHLSRGPGRGFEPPRQIPWYGRERLFYDRSGELPSYDVQFEDCASPLLIDIDGDGVPNLVRRDYDFEPVNLADLSQGADFRETWKALVLDGTRAEWINTGLAFQWRVSWENLSMTSGIHSDHTNCNTKSSMQTATVARTCSDSKRS